MRPLGCFYWSEVWTLAAWCEVREDFRNFRVDRIERLEALDERFRDEPGKTLADLFRQVEGEMSERDAQHRRLRRRCGAAHCMRAHVGGDAGLRCARRPAARIAAAAPAWPRAASAFVGVPIRPRRAASRGFGDDLRTGQRRGGHRRGEASP